MWPLPPVQNKSLHIILQPEQVSCYYIKLDNNQLPVPSAYQRYDLPISTATIIYNPTALKNAIDSFIQLHHLQHGLSHIVLLKPLVEERLIKHSNSYASLEDLVKPNSATKYYHTYIGPSEDQFLFYVCAIAQPLLLQLRMLHNQIPLHLQSICSPLSIQYELYNHIHASQFSQTQLALSIDPEKIEIKNIRNSGLFKHDKTGTYDENLLYAIGSFIGSNR